MKTTTQARLPVRQGDVLFIPVANIPRGCKKRKNGTVAYGEVTGHSHTVMSAGTAAVLEHGAEIYVDVQPAGIAHDAERLRDWLRRIIEDAHETAFRKQRAAELATMLPVAGAFFCHGSVEERSANPVPAMSEDRHMPIALLPGAYLVCIQREYSPEEIRNVLD